MFIVVIIHKITAFIDPTSQIPHHSSISPTHLLHKQPTFDERKVATIKP